MIPATLNLPTFVAGDTWEGLGQFRVWQIDPATKVKTPPASAVAAAKIHFARTLDQPAPDFTLTAGEAGFGLDDAAEWRFSVPPQPLALTPGDYFHKLVTLDAADVRKTYWTGKIRVLQPPPGA